MKRIPTTTGMSLIEVLITIMIMATAAAITVPSIMDLQRTGAEARAASLLKGELMPACLQFQQIYDATRDKDGDQLGDFPLHPACLCGGQAGLYYLSEPATAGAALTTDLIDRNIWGNKNGNYYSNPFVNLRLPSGTTSFAYNGALVGGYSFGFFTGGTPHFNDASSTLLYETSLRDVMITIFATPSDRGAGHRSFAMSINPFLYRGMVAQTIAPDYYFPYHGWYLSYSANAFGSGMFYYPTGVPVAEAASAATGGVPIPQIFRLNTTITSQMR